MKRLLAHAWFAFVICATAILSDLRPVLRLRGWLVRPCFRSCGRRLEIASGVRINFTTRITVGDDVYIGPSSWINAVGGVTLDDEVMLGPYTVLATSEHTQINGSYRFGIPICSPIHIGRGSWTGAHAVVIRGVHIGAGALVAAGSVVTKDVHSGSVVGGIPARVLSQGSGETGESSMTHATT